MSPLRILGMVAIVVLVIIGYVAVRDYKRSAEQAYHDTERLVEGPAVPASTPKPATPQSRGEARLRAARAVWDEFDRLPEGMKTADMVRAFTMRASQLAEGVDEPWATQIQQEAMVSGRFAVAEVYGGKSTPPGQHDIFIPDDDPATCLARSPQFRVGSKGADALKAWGFHAVRCKGTGTTVETTWQLE